MKRTFALFCTTFGIIIVAFAALSLLQGRYQSPHENESKKYIRDAPKQVRRIVSLAPGTTEILYALGLGDNVVGVTTFCTYPPQAAEKPKVGGYIDPAFESIMALQPDLVILSYEHRDYQDYFTQMNLPFIMVKNRTIQEILESIMTIGSVCSRKQEAARIVADLEERIQAIRQKLSSAHRPRVLVSIGRTMGGGTLKDVYIAGRNGFYDEMISLAGGINAYQDRQIAFPLLSAEGILRVNPEIIIDIVADSEAKGPTEDLIRAEWQTVSPVDAVKNGRVHVLGEEYALIPGPRFILLLEKMATVIHPELFPAQ